MRRELVFRSGASDWGGGIDTQPICRAQDNVRGERKLQEYERWWKRGHDQCLEPDCMAADEFVGWFSLWRDSTPSGLGLAELHRWWGCCLGIRNE